MIGPWRKRFVIWTKWQKQFLKLSHLQMIWRISLSFFLGANIYSTLIETSELGHLSMFFKNKNWRKI
jgi:hypothetical protein